MNVLCYDLETHDISGINSLYRFKIIIPMMKTSLQVVVVFGWGIREVRENIYGWCNIVFLTRVRYSIVHDLSKVIQFDSEAQID